MRHTDGPSPKEPLVVSGISTTGADALSLVQQIDPDVVLMDYRPSDGTGTEVALGVGPSLGLVARRESRR